MGIPYRDSRMVGVNERGDRVGEDHPRAKLSDAEIDLIRELLDPLDGAPRMAHREIAAKFEISRGTVSDIASCRRRAVVPTSFRRVAIPVTGRMVEPMRAKVDPVDVGQALSAFADAGFGPSLLDADFAIAIGKRKQWRGIKRYNAKRKVNG